MAKSMNKVILIGTVGRDAETSYTQSGKSVSKFSMATNRSWKKGDEWVEETDWHNIVVWGAEKLAEYITKGSKIGVEGRLQSRSYEDKNGDKKYVTEIVADNGGIVLMGGNQSGRGNAVSQSDGYAGDEPPF
jgi:single-strand DNA-binding protein